MINYGVMINNKKITNYKVKICKVYYASQNKGKPFPFQVSLIAQLVKNPPTMQEILVLFLGQEDPLEKE